jgi:hypothetical protein
MRMYKYIYLLIVLYLLTPSTILSQKIKFGIVTSLMYGVGEEPIIYRNNELFVKMEKSTNWRLFLWGLSFSSKLHQNYPFIAGLNVNYGKKNNVLMREYKSGQPGNKTFLLEK